MMLRLQRCDTRSKNPNYAFNRVNSPEAPLAQWVNCFSSGYDQVTGRPVRYPVFQTRETEAWVGFLVSHGNYRLVKDEAAVRDLQFYNHGIITQEEYQATLA